MGNVWSAVRALAAIGFAGALGACDAVSGAAGPGTRSDATSRGGDDGGSPTTSNGAAIVRVRCEVRAGRSKISVDGNNLRPLNGTFAARVQSGANIAAAAPAKAVGDEAEFDFDSDPGDIREGATPIPATFISGSVTGTILDAQGNEIVRGQTECERR